MTWDQGCLVVGSVLWGYILLALILGLLFRPPTSPRPKG